MNASDSEAEKATLRGCCNAVALLRRFEHGAGRESENLFSRPSRSRVCLSKHGEQTIPSKCIANKSHSCYSCDSWSRKELTNIGLPDFSLSQGVDFFISEKNFILKGIVYQKKCVYLHPKSTRVMSVRCKKSICIDSL